VTGLKEHKTEVEATTSKPFTRRQRLSSYSEQNKSALTDHASHDNWSESAVLDRESDRGTDRLRKQCTSERKDGSYALSHAYDQFLARSHHYRGKNRKKNCTSSFDEGLW